ncbi:cytochrome P450 2U1-like isoform X1 [Ptychodera flava]|uniref:cytochrome P450 2U1-like isoform X1 n=1 Tax=Ptychodera flava TaxID=63121 RepID=UPI00396A3B65
MDIQAYIVSIVAFLAILWLFNRSHNTPPGPLALPLVGNMLSLSKDAYLDFDKMADRYGSVFQLKLGPTTAVILHGYDAVYQAFVRQGADFSDRPSVGVFERLVRDPQYPDTGGKRGSFFFEHYGHAWRTRRKFCLRAFQRIGFRNKILEGNIHKEFTFFSGVLDKCGRHPFDPKTAIMNMVTNTTCSLIFGKRFEYDDVTFKELVRVCFDIGREITLGSPGNFFPFLCDLPFAYRNLKNMIKFMRETINKATKEHTETINPAAPRDIIDLYLLEILKERRKPGEGTEVFTEKFLWRGVLDIFQAGSETTSGALCWAFLYMAVHTDVQEKVQKEIEDVIGSTRPATYSDKTSMPYTAATIKEILRLANVTPYAVPRCTSADTTLYQYVIPKGTMIMASVWSVHHDKKYWQDVETFLPERFLDETGNIVHKDAYIPFSLGPRNCLGKQLVNVMMFLIFVNALQKYSLSLPENEPSPDLKGMSSTTRVPMPYRLCALKR